MQRGGTGIAYEDARPGKPVGMTASCRPHGPAGVGEGGTGVPLILAITTSISSGSPEMSWKGPERPGRAGGTVAAGGWGWLLPWRVSLVGRARHLRTM